MTQEQIPLFPVAAWSIGPVPSLGLVTIKFDFLTNLMQDSNTPNPGRHYALTPAQAQELVTKIQSALHVLENTSPQAPLGHAH